LAPAGWVVSQAPQRFGFLRDISRFHGAYSSEKAKRAVPEFRCDIGFVTGARETLADMKRRGAWRRHEDDAQYAQIVQRALELDFEELFA
jgi:hypothetical protein